MWNFIIVLLAVAFYCYRSPFFHVVDPVSHSVELPNKLEGPLAPNTALDKAEKLHHEALHWPEGLATLNGKIYTGLGDGRIVEVSSPKVINVTRTGEECAGQHEEHKCGRPLGMTFTKTGNLYVADAYLGVFSIDVKTGKKVNVLPAKTVVDGLPLTLLNDITFDEKEQALYITQSSTKWNLSYVMVCIFEHDTSGRLLKYNLKTKEVSVVLHDLSLPNGVEISHSGDSLLFAEVNSKKIFRYYIHGEKKGLKEVFLAVPGEPDNISRSNRGTYWVPVLNARTMDSMTIYDKLADKPLVRKAIIFAHKIIATPISIVMTLLPYDWSKEFAFELQSGRIVADYLPSYGMILEFNENGKILRSYHSPSGAVTHISEILEHNGYLYLGSWRNRYLGRLKL